MKKSNFKKSFSLTAFVIYATVRWSSFSSMKKSPSFVSLPFNLKSGKDYWLGADCHQIILRQLYWLIVEGYISAQPPRSRSVENLNSPGRSWLGWVYYSQSLLEIGFTARLQNSDTDGLEKEMFAWCQPRDWERDSYKKSGERILHFSIDWHDPTTFGAVHTPVILLPCT